MDEWYPLPEVEDNVWDDAMSHEPSVASQGSSNIDLCTPTWTYSQTQRLSSRPGISPASLNAAFSPLALEETLTPKDDGHLPSSTTLRGHPSSTLGVSTHDLTITSILSTSTQSDTPWTAKHHGTVGNSVSSEKSVSTHLDPSSSSGTLMAGYQSSTEPSLYAPRHVSRDSLYAPRHVSQDSLCAPRHVSPSELDQLWRRFLATSITPQVPSTTNYTSSKHLCTCNSTTDHHETHKVSGGNAVRSAKQSTGMSTSQSVPHPMLSSHYPPVTRKDMSVQTTPSLLQLPASQPGRNTFSTPPEAPTSTLTPLTLQEALEVFHPQFIVQSKKRERRVREKGRERQRREEKIRREERLRREERRPNPIGSGTETDRTPKFFHVDVRRNRPRMSTREMYEQSKRYWEKLPEVQEKVNGRRRQAQAATNRLRVRLYQKEVLARLRLNRRKKTM